MIIITVIGFCVESLVKYSSFLTYSSAGLVPLFFFDVFHSWYSFHDVNAMLS